MNLGAPEIVLILLLALLLFGGKRLPELARSLGKGMAEFRRATQAIQRDLQNPLQNNDPPNKPPTTQSSSTNQESSQAVTYAQPTAQPGPSKTPSEPNS